MTSRDTILAQVKANQPDAVPVPEIPEFAPPGDNWLESFVNVLTGIGGNVVTVSSWQQVRDHLSAQFPIAARMVSSLPQFPEFHPHADIQDPHSLEDVDVAIFAPRFGVAENGSCWLTNDDMPDRVLPFICQDLVFILDPARVVPTMHAAYERIGALDYDLGLFIAGPSKTADIEQSLVLGAHGPKSLTVFLLPS